MSATGFVVVPYFSKGRGVMRHLHYRLHRADCRTLQPTTRTEPWTPGMNTTRHCGVCKPRPSETSPLPTPSQEA